MLRVRHLMRELKSTPTTSSSSAAAGFIADTSVNDLLDAASSRRVTIRTPTPSQVMTLLAGARATVASTGQDTLTVTGLLAPPIADLIAERGLRLYELAPQHASLEEAYLELTKDAVDFEARSSTDWGINP